MSSVLRTTCYRKSSGGVWINGKGVMIDCFLSMIRDIESQRYESQRDESHHITSRHITLYLVHTVRLNKYSKRVEEDCKRFGAGRGHCFRAVSGWEHYK